MPDSNPVMRRSAPAVVPALRPSEYTSALIQVLRAEAARVGGARALEIGCGSGVVLAALGTMGAASLCGIDIEPDAIAASTRLLDDLDHGAIAELHQGDMWRPVAGRRFDLIVANLPHFPMEPVEFGGRLPTWSAGGTDGRRLLDPFLEGLADHLAPGGRAVITHNAFDDLARSRELVAQSGLSIKVALTTLVYISPEKLARMTADVLRTESGHTLYRHGPYTFGEMHIVEIAAAGTAI
ncbi:MAG: methyltransferase domain-containing protein [Reyranella sp.]|nr:methyltransferase domain-containing protein [Reyranella sp.]